jgi:serine/threonine protein kinase
MPCFVDDFKLDVINGNTAFVWFTPLPWCSLLIRVMQHYNVVPCCRPENLLLDEDFNLRLADWGLSAILEDIDHSYMRTTCGTSFYMVRAFEVYTRMSQLIVHQAIST